MRNWQEQDNESQKEALRAFRERERLNPYVGGRELLELFAKIALIAGLLFLLAYKLWPK